MRKIQTVIKVFELLIGYHNRATLSHFSDRIEVQFWFDLHIHIEICIEYTEIERGCVGIEVFSNYSSIRNERQKQNKCKGLAALPYI